MNDDARRRVQAALLGAVVGDALGVPFEFLSREQTRSRFTGAMTGYGTYNQPPGTWSDDSSMLLCTAEVYAKGFSLPLLADTFVRWMDQAHMTPHGRVFDCGITTSSALRRYHSGASVAACGCTEEGCNGNGSLMRIAPVAIYHAFSSDAELCKTVSSASAITHAHPRSRLGCVIFSLLIANVLQSFVANPALASSDALRHALVALHRNHHGVLHASAFSPELPHYHRIFLPGFKELPVDRIYSDGYVIHTLEASLWCVLRNTSFRDAVSMAVALGSDCDTTACVTGVLAGLLFGVESIPEEWVGALQSRERVLGVIDDFIESTALAWG